jgi:DNA repair protein RecO (recombination protein O)
VYALFDNTLARIAFADDARLALRYFEIHLLNLVGFRPEVTECVIGHEPVQPLDQWFSYADGGVICPKHAPQKASSTVQLPMNTLKLLRILQRSPWNEIEALTLSPSLHADIERILSGYTTHILERRLQSADFIRRVRRSPDHEHA